MRAKFTPKSPGAIMSAKTLRAAVASLALTLALVLAWSSTGHAAMATPEQAAEMAQVIELRMTEWFTPEDDEDDEDAVVEWYGPVKVEPEGERYVVHLPPSSVTDKIGTRIEIGTIRLDVEPMADGAYKVAALLPATFPILGNDDSHMADLTIGAQRFESVWSAETENFLSVDADFRSLAIKSLDDSARIDLDSLIVRQNLEQSSPGRFSGPSSLSLEKLMLKGSGGDSLLKIDRLDLSSAVESIDLAQQGRLSREFGTLESTDIDSAESAAEIKRQLRLLYDLLGGLSIDLKADGITAHDPDSGTDVAIADLSTSLSVSGLRDGKSRIGLGYHHAGFSLTPDPSIGELMPREVDAFVQVTGLPNDGLWRALIGYVNTVQKSGKHLADKQVGEKVFDLLAKAGSRFEVSKFRFLSPNVESSLEGSAVLDAKAPFSSAGEARAVIRGVEDAIKMLGAEKPTAEVQQMLAVASMVQVLGQIGKDEAGRDVRIYDLRFPPDGKVTLNGVDMSALMGLQGAGNAPVKRK
jgi:hypothetical protein